MRIVFILCFVVLSKLFAQTGINNVLKKYKIPETTEFCNNSEIYLLSGNIFVCTGVDLNSTNKDLCYSHGRYLVIGEYLFLRSYSQMDNRENIEPIIRDFFNKNKDNSFNSESSIKFINCTDLKFTISGNELIEAY